MNTFFIIGLFERMLREWMGTRGQLKQIGSLQFAVYKQACRTNDQAWSFLGSVRRPNFP